jgi:hypothetical protein
MCHRKGGVPLFSQKDRAQAAGRADRQTMPSGNPKTRFYQAVQGRWRETTSRRAKAEENALHRARQAFD